MRFESAAPRTIPGVRPDAFAAILPEGVDPPPDIPPEVFDLALRTHLGSERIEMSRLAAELGVSRPTLWRWIGSRDRLLGELLWYGTRRIIAEGLEAADGLSGSERVLATIDHLMRRVNAQPPLRRLLEGEAEIALRVLTSKRGPVQSGIVGTLERLLEEEAARGLVLSMPARQLAFAIVRLGESFLYADVISDQEPDIDAAMELIAGILTGQTVDA